MTLEFFGYGLVSPMSMMHILFSDRSWKYACGRFQRYVCDILTTFFIFETLQMNEISLQDV